MVDERKDQTGGDATADTAGSDATSLGAESEKAGAPDADGGVGTADGDKKPAAEADGEKAAPAAPKRKPAPARKAGARAARAAAKGGGDGDGGEPKPGTYPKARKEDPERQKRIAQAKAQAAKAAVARRAAQAAGQPAKKAPVDPAPGTKAFTRRDFVRLGIWGSAVLFLGQLTGSFLQFFWPLKVGAFGGVINLGSVDQYPPGTVTRVPAAKLFLAHVPDGLLAINWTCTHLGCVVPWKPEAHVDKGGCFCCGCHGSEFSITGEKIGGPAPRPLDLYPITIEDGNVLVDTGTVVEREQYLPSQATPV